MNINEYIVYHGIRYKIVEKNVRGYILEDGSHRVIFISRRELESEAELLRNNDNEHVY